MSQEWVLSFSVLFSSGFFDMINDHVDFFSFNLVHRIAQLDFVIAAVVFGGNPAFLKHAIEISILRFYFFF